MKSGQERNSKEGQDMGKIQSKNKKGMAKTRSSAETVETSVDEIITGASLTVQSVDEIISRASLTVQSITQEEKARPSESQDLEVLFHSPKGSTMPLESEPEDLEDDGVDTKASTGLPSSFQIPNPNDSISISGTSKAPTESMLEEDSKSKPLTPIGENQFVSRVPSVTNLEDGEELAETIHSIKSRSMQRPLVYQHVREEAEITALVIKQSESEGPIGDGKHNIELRQSKFQVYHDPRNRGYTKKIGGGDLNSAETEKSVDVVKEIEEEEEGEEEYPQSEATTSPDVFRREEQDIPSTTTTLQTQEEQEDASSDLQSRTSYENPHQILFFTKPVTARSGNLSRRVDSQARLSSSARPMTYDLSNTSRRETSEMEEEVRVIHKREGLEDKQKQEVVESESGSRSRHNDKKLKVKGLKKFVETRGGHSHPPLWLKEFPAKSKFHVDNFINDWDKAGCQHPVGSAGPKAFQKRSGRCSACGIYSVDTCRCCKKCHHDCQCPQPPRMMPDLGQALGPGWSQAQRVICELTENNNRRSLPLLPAMEGTGSEESRPKPSKKPRPPPRDYLPHLKCHIDVMNPGRCLEQRQGEVDQEEYGAQHHSCCNHNHGGCQGQAVTIPATPMPMTTNGYYQYPSPMMPPFYPPPMPMTMPPCYGYPPPPMMYPYPQYPQYPAYYPPPPPGNSHYPSSYPYPPEAPDSYNHHYK